MRVPIKALKEFSIKYKLGHIIVFARDEDGKFDHIATYGKTIEQCSQAADFGNSMKKALKWPETLQKQPSRVRKIQNQFKEVMKIVKEVQEAFSVFNDSDNSQGYEDLCFAMRKFNKIINKKEIENKK